MAEETQLAPGRPALTPRRWEFVRQYVALNNGSAAARKAGYSERSASSEASRLLKNDEVQAAIEWYRASEADRIGVTPERVLEELAAVAFSDLGEYIRIVDGVPVVDMSELPAGATRALASISNTDKGTTFKLHDKLAALTTLARSFGLLAGEAPAVNVNVGAAESVELSTLTAEEIRAGLATMRASRTGEVVEIPAEVGQVSPTATTHTASVSEHPSVAGEPSDESEDEGGTPETSDSSEE
jgi:phage terminase small subunit